MLTATNPLLCDMTVTLLWKCNELIVTQQELLRYYSNATQDLTCHNMSGKNVNSPYLLTHPRIYKIYETSDTTTTLCPI
jgi:predicted transglutaminase-like protease